MRLTLLPGDYTVFHYGQTNLKAQGVLFSLTVTESECSYVSEDRYVPTGATKAERGWKALRVEGPLDFSLVGVLASIVGPLAEAGISIFSLATFDTDYVLLKNDKLPAAIEVLGRAGHQIQQ